MSNLKTQIESVAKLYLSSDKEKRIEVGKMMLSKEKIHDSHIYSRGRTSRKRQAPDN